MSNTVIQLKFSAVSGNTPTALANGELAINTYDGKLFYRGGASNTVQSITRYTGPAGLDTELQFNDAGSLGGSQNLTFNKTTSVLTVAGTVRANIHSNDGTDLFVFANGAYNTANAAFLAANASTATDTTQNNSITAAFTAANSASVYANGAFITANSAGVYANGAFARANNSLNVQAGGAVTGNLTITGNLTVLTLATVPSLNVTTTITTGSGTGGVISGANTVYSNVFVANTSGYFQFADGTKQYTANSGGGGTTDTFARNQANAAFAFANTISAGSVDTFARNQANAAFSAANTAQSTATSAQGTASSAASDASFALSTACTAQTSATTANDTATSAFIQANAAFIKANTGTGNASFADYFPTGDWGTLTDATTSAFGEDLTVLYDCRVDPITPKNYLLTKDFGYLA